MTRLTMLLLLAASCASTGPEGEPGPAGQRGAPGPPGASPPPLTTYVVEVTAESPADAWCDEGDVPVGGGCAADAGLRYGRPHVVDDELVGWECGTAEPGLVTVYALCAEGADGG